MAADTEADGEDRFEIVVLDLARNRAVSLGSNHPATPDSCLSGRLALVVDVHEVLDRLPEGVDVAHRGPQTDAEALGDVVCGKALGGAESGAHFQKAGGWRVRVRPDFPRHGQVATFNALVGVDSGTATFTTRSAAGGGRGRASETRAHATTTRSWRIGSSPAQ